MKGEEVSHYILFINSHEGREKRKVETRYNFFSAQDSHKWMWWKSQRVCNHRADFINHTDHRFALSFLLNRCSLSDRWAAGHTEMKQDDSASAPPHPTPPPFCRVQVCVCVCVCVCPHGAVSREPRQRQRRRERWRNAHGAALPSLSSSPVPEEM